MMMKYINTKLTIQCQLEGNPSKCTYAQSLLYCLVFYCQLGYEEDTIKTK